MHLLSVNGEKGGIKMKKINKVELIPFWVVLWSCLLATPVFAKSFSLKDAGISLWIFIIIAAFIILLQLIPAAILFFSFIGTGTAMAFKRKKAVEGEHEKEETTLPGYSPVKIEK